MGGLFVIKLTLFDDIKINLLKLVDMCVDMNCQQSCNILRKNLTEGKILLKVLLATLF